jgi:hypothetical protein
LICNVYDRSEDTHSFLGTVQIRPTLTNDHTVDHWYKYAKTTLVFITHANSFVSRLTPLENEPVTGEMRVQITFEACKVGNTVGISVSTTPLTGGITE